MTIKAILDMKPGAHEILRDFGLGCATCELGNFETLSEGARSHGLADKEIRELTDLINSDSI
jgi:hybrid cluster-associated redox disulfide protein